MARLIFRSCRAAVSGSHGYWRKPDENPDNLFIGAENTQEMVKAGIL
jgi:hypothetical protein